MFLNLFLTNFLLTIIATPIILLDLNFSKLLLAEENQSIKQSCSLESSQTIDSLNFRIV